MVGLHTETVLDIPATSRYAGIHGMFANEGMLQVGTCLPWELSYCFQTPRLALVSRGRSRGRQQRVIRKKDHGAIPPGNGYISQQTGKESFVDFKSAGGL